MVNNITIYLRHFFVLIKLWVSLAVTVTTLVAYVLNTKQMETAFAGILLAVFLLAAGASALNQVQEYKTDALMGRTRKRPIPSGIITTKSGIFISAALIVTGSILLYLSAGLIPFLLGLFNIIWYNGLYISLKFKTAFAIIPGSLSGVLPAAIGWTAAGGHLSSPVLIILGFFLWMWQIPHFWILILQYGKEYEQAGLSSLTSIFSAEQLRGITFVWVVATCITSLMLPLFGLLNNLWFIALFAVAFGWIVMYFIRNFILSSENKPVRRAFVMINMFQALVMLLLVADQLI
jgi:protoheme IX farnesyltransferase